MDFQLIPTPSLDFQVALNFGETAPLKSQRRPILLKVLCQKAGIQFDRATDHFLQVNGQEIIKSRKGSVTQVPSL